MKRDAFGELCDLLRECGATLRFHGVPVTEDQMREIAGRTAVRRIESRMAPALAASPQIEEHW